MFMQTSCRDSEREWVSALSRTADVVGGPFVTSSEGLWSWLLDVLWGDTRVADGGVTLADDRMWGHWVCPLPRLDVLYANLLGRALYGGCTPTPTRPVPRHGAVL